MNFVSRSRTQQLASPPIGYSTDSFVSAWGASTQWKTGASRTQRFSKGSAIPDPSHTHGTLLAPTTPPQLNESPYLFDKPLPPLPFEIFAPPALPSSGSYDLTCPPPGLPHSQPEPELLRIEVKTVESLTNHGPAKGNKPNGLKRKSFFSFGRNKKAKIFKAQDGTTPSNRPEDDGQKYKESQEQTPFPVRRQIVGAKANGPRTVDHGTQTTPGLEEYSKMRIDHHERPTAGKSTVSKPRMQLPILPSPKAVMEAMPTPVEGLRTPPWSPREALNVSGPYDYFDLPLEKVEYTAGESSKAETNALQTYPQYFKQHAPPSPRRRSETDATDHSIATYESRYSDHKFDVPKNSARLSVDRDARSSDTTIVSRVETRKAEKPPTRSHSRSEAMEKYAQSSPDRESSPSPSPKSHAKPPEAPQTSTVSEDEEITQITQVSQILTGSRKPSSPQSRPLPTPYQNRFSASSYMRNGRRESSSGSTGPTSPLRQEVKLSDFLPEREAMRQPSFGFFRMPVYGNTAHTESADPEVPDHLLGSPLCPMNTKHKSGGTGVCPYHGRLRSLSEDTVTDVRGSREQSSTNDQDDAEFWREMESGTYGGGGRSVPKEDSPQFMLNIEDHKENSLQCPANPRYNGPGAKGICILHGRGRRKLWDSDESVPRVMIK